jgi:hypothetical protein
MQGMTPWCAVLRCDHCANLPLLAEGKAIPTELRTQAEKIRKDIELDHVEAAKLKVRVSLPGLGHHAARQLVKCVDSRKCGKSDRLDPSWPLAFVSRR